MALSLVPASLRGYDKTWLARDVVAGLTLSAVAIPEVMGYTSIAQTPIVTGLYTVIFPTAGVRAAVLVAAAGRRGRLGHRRGHGGGADRARRGRPPPNSPEWVAYASLVALVTAALLVVARVLNLGFIGDFLSASVLIGFLTGVGVQVLTGQLPDMLGIPKGKGNWLEQQWDLLTSLGSVQLADVRLRAGGAGHHHGLREGRPRGARARWWPSRCSPRSRRPSTPRPTGWPSWARSPRASPRSACRRGLSWSTAVTVIPIAFACLVLILAQSAATSRSSR